MTDDFMRCPPHQLCEPGCWQTAKDWFPHCWKCGEQMADPAAVDLPVRTSADHPGGLADRPRRWHVDVMSEEFQRAFRSELSSLLLIVFVAGAVLACGVLILLGWWVVR